MFAASDHQLEVRGCVCPFNVSFVERMQDRRTSVTEAEILFANTAWSHSLQCHSYYFLMSLPTPKQITLRRTAEADVRLLHTFELDPHSNELAGTKPRDWGTFQARWAQILADPDGTATGVTPRVILADGALVGAINISPQDGLDSIGYWIAREHWGRGIATRAVALMLGEFAKRPLMATAAAHNHPSIRVLEKNGFEIVSRCMTPETARTVQRETVTLLLR